MKIERKVKRQIFTSKALFNELNDYWGEAQALKTLGLNAQFLGDYAEAVDFYQKSLVLFRGLGVQMETVETQRYLGFVLSLIGRLEEAEPLLRECIAVSRRLGDQTGLANGLYILITTLWLGGTNRDISEFIEECISINEKLGDHIQLAKVLMRQGMYKLGLGEYDQAREILQKSYTLFQETGTIWGMAESKMASRRTGAGQSQ